MGRKNQAKLQKYQTKSTHNLNSNQKVLQETNDQLLKLCTSQYETNLNKNLETQQEIARTVENIQILEKSIEFPFNDDHRNSATLAKFTKWMKDNGAKFEGIEVGEFDGYELGLKTTTDVEQSSLLISIPRELMLTIDSAKKSELKKLIQIDMLLSNMSNVTLALFLLLEKFKENSFWKPYIDILPIDYPTVLYFSLDDLKELQASPTLEGALKQIKSIVRQYTYFYKLIWSSDDPACKILRKHFTFNEYRWAVSTVMTRQNTVPSEDGSSTISALIPLWDFCNHTNGSITTVYHPELRRCECLAVRNFKAGEQIFIFYGERSNAELFIHNGFVYDANEHDGYCLHLGISKSDVLKEKRRLLLNKLAIPEHGEFWLKRNKVPIDQNLLAFLRVFNMDNEKLTHWLNLDNVNQLQSFEFSIFEESFEKKYWSFLLNRIKLILATYKTTLDDDLKLISDTKLSNHRKLAIQMRIAEKQILNCAMNYSKSKIKE